MIEVMKNETAPAGLTIEQVTALKRAILRLNALNSKAILTSDSETEKEALSRFVAEAMIANADEFVGTWLVTHNEYIPLCRVWTAFNHRCASFVRKAPPARVETQAETVIDPPTDSVQVDSEARPEGDK